jgi:hypothetical protein
MPASSAILLASAETAAVLGKWVPDSVIAESLRDCLSVQTSIKKRQPFPANQRACGIAHQPLPLGPLYYRGRAEVNGFWGKTGRPRTPAGPPQGQRVGAGTGAHPYAPLPR